MNNLVFVGIKIPVVYPFLYCQCNTPWIDIVVYSCPMKTHHSSDAHICGLSNAVPKCVIHNCYLGQMQCFRENVSIPVTLLTHDVTSASILRKSRLVRIQKDPKISF